MSSIDDREETRYRQDVLLAYRSWLAYLDAQQCVLAAARATRAGSDPFEGASAEQERAAAAERRIAALPADRRELFDAVYAEERAAQQRSLDAKAPLRGGTVQHADADEAARRALERLIEEARGLHRDDRRGLVPRGKPDAVKWLAIDLSEVAGTPPSETDYQLAGGQRDRRRKLILNGVFAALAILAIPVLISLLQPRAPATSARAVVSNGVELTPWAIRAVSGGAEEWSLAVTRAADRWPEGCRGTSTEQACWLAGSVRPLRLCLPAARLAGLDALRLHGPGALPARIFALDALDAAHADLIVEPCPSAEAEAEPRYGRLAATEPLAALAPGDPAPEGFRVTAIQVRGRGDDPALPEGRMEISVVVEDEQAERDWVPLAPTLLLADGSAELAGDITRAEGRVQFDYLVAERAEPFEVAWQVSPSADQIVRYRAALEPPATRDAVLRAGLEVSEIAVEPSRQTMTVRATLRNAATTPLTLVPADLAFQTAGRRVAVAAATLQSPLAPGERREVALDLPLESGVLEVGPLRFQLTVRR